MPTTKKGIEILFEHLGNEKLKEITENFERDLYSCLRLASQTTEFIGSYLSCNFPIAYLTLRQMKLVNINTKEDKITLTDEGKKVYNSLVKAGIYRKH